jgi:hypothetical protein
LAPSDEHLRQNFDPNPFDATLGEHFKPSLDPYSGV